MFKKVLSILLAVVMATAIIPTFEITSFAATSHSQSEAVAWAKSQIGKGLDYDGEWGAQCVDLIAYYYNYLGATVPGGNACDYSSNALPSGWRRIAYYNGFVAQPGDIAVWTYATNAYGHIAIVVSANANTMTVIDQRGSGHTNAGYSEYQYSSMTFYGVIRPDFSGTSVPYAKPEIVRTYINYQQENSYRVNIEVTNFESISSVQVATWTQQSQSDLHWNNCYYNGFGTYFIDLSRSDFAPNQNSYCNDVYVYDIYGECVAYERIGTIYTSNPKPEIVRTYINYQQQNSYRVNIEVTNVESISSVQVATWTQQDQSDLHWNNCYYNGYGTYFIDLSRSDFASNQKNYCNDVYVYGANGECFSYARIGTIYTPPLLEDVQIEQLSSQGYKVSAKIKSQFGISSAQFPTWTENGGQDDLIWHKGMVDGDYVTCYIDASSHNNETDRYITHIYVTDNIGQESCFINVLPYIYLADGIDSENEIDTDYGISIDSETESEIETETENESETETDTEIVSESDTETLVDTETETDTDTVTDTEVEKVAGDINGDDKLDIIDVALARAFIVGTKKLDISSQQKGDVNSDNILDIIDVVMMRKAIVG